MRTAEGWQSVPGEEAARLCRRRGGHDAVRKVAGWVGPGGPAGGWADSDRTRPGRERARTGGAGAGRAGPAVRERRPEYWRPEGTAGVMRMLAERSRSETWRASLGTLPEWVRIPGKNLQIQI